MSVEALLILSCILLVVVGWVVYGILKAAREIKTLKERGVTTTAVVTERKSGYDQGTRRWSYALMLRYSVNATDYQQKVGVNPDTYNQFPEGSPVEVLYLPENPKSVMLKPTP